MTDEPKTPPPSDDSATNSESSPEPTPEPTPEPAAESGATGAFDVNRLLEFLVAYLKDPKSLWETIQSILKDPTAFFGQSEATDLNRSLGFLGCMLIYGLGFSLLGMILTLNVAGFFLIIPGFLIFSLIWLLLASIVVWVFGKPVAKGEGTIQDGARVVSWLSWISLINAFPLFVFLPGILQALITIGSLALWAYLAIPAIAVTFKTPGEGHKLPVWIVAGILALFTLVSSLLGTGAKVVSESYSDVIAQTEQKVREMEAEYMEQLEEERAAEAAALAAAEAAAQASSQPVAEDPKKAVRDILKQLRQLGSADVPRELKQAFRKYNGHLQGADFSGIEVKGLDLRMLDLTGARFRNAVMTDWTFHGIGNTPSSTLDEADFSGATMENVNMTGVSAKGADFSKVTLVGRERARTVLDLEEADVSNADFSDISFEGNVDAKALYLGRAVVEGASFRESQLPNSDFTKARLRGADLREADLREAVLNGADIRNANFSGADLTGMEITEQMTLDHQFKPFDNPMPMTEGANFSEARLDGVNFQARIFRFCDFSGASFVNANLEAGNFVGSNFSKADLSGAVLKRANFAAVDFSGAKFHQNDWENAHLAGAQIREIEPGEALLLPPLPAGSKIPRLREGRQSDAVADIVNGSRTNQVGADLEKVSFAKQRLTRIDFTGANLKEADFNYAELGRCNFSRANLQGASFAFARINQCTFDEADLTGASFHGAAMSSNSFVKAILRKADFQYAGRAEWSISDRITFAGADLQDADFRMARLSYLLPSGLKSRRENTLAMGIGLGGSSGYVNFDGADLSGADLSDAWLIEASLAGANLSDMTARRTDLSGFYSNWDTIWGGADLREANLAFGQIWHKDTKRVTDGKTDFREADVRGANLFRFAFTPGTHIGAADFSGCVFGADPWGKITDFKNGPAGTDLGMVNFEGATFKGADLRNCGFTNSNLNGASFEDADLSRAFFDVGNAVQAGGGLEANLKDWSLRYLNIDFSGARLDEANFDAGIFTGSDFSGTSSRGTEVHRDSSSSTPDGISYMNYAYGVPASIGGS
jgi:uncharacterized protein YjbI with pentapeptide repeats